MVRKTATILVVITSISLAVYSFLLITVGQGRDSVDEVTQIRETVYVPTPAAIPPLICATLILIGLFSQKSKVYWVGTICLVIYSVLGLFGVGGTVLPSSLVILLLLVTMNVFKTKN